ncbi:MAG TPA: sodium:proton antiporter [Chloroflexota bacterium]|nr:sodium:proton antiporter [Chloroflexota bacterium]
MMPGLAILSTLIVLYGAVALRLGRWSISMPMVFVAVGFLLGPGGTGILHVSPQTEVVKTLTEITLGLLLFADASTLNLRQVRADAHLPLRLLTIGLPLTIGLGTVLAWGLLPAEGLAFAALLGAILAPTDAALGLPIFTNKAVPVRIRRTLNVESGLNDGIATPCVTLFLAVAVATEEHARGGWLTTAVLQIVLAVVVGAMAGIIGGRLLMQTTRRGWTAGGSEQIAILGLGLAAYFGVAALGGNSFIAAFTCGIVFAAATRHQFAEPTEFTETLGMILSLLVWAIFGAVLLPEAFRNTTEWRPIVYAILSLTVVRMLPVALALIGTGLRPDTIALMGWFGPRGLASVVFTLLAFVRLEQAGRPIDTLEAVATWTILLSVLAHGLSAQPLSAWYARRLKAAGGKPVELVEPPETRPRHTHPDIVA